MDYNLIILPRAEIQVIDSVYYYEMKQVGLGERFLESVKQTLLKIKSHPTLYQQKRKPFREAVLNKFPFVVIYTIRNYEIIVTDVFHTSQDPSKKPE